MNLTSSLFKTFDVPLERGRIFLPEEETAGRDHVAILSHTLWQTRFDCDAGTPHRQTRHNRWRAVL